MGAARSQLANACGSLSDFFDWASRTLSKKPERAVDLTLIATEGKSTKKPERAVHLTPATKILEGIKSTEERLIADARKKLGMDVTNHFNFAFVGQSGVGKSSLINALRQLRDNDPDAAPVGEAETTPQIKRYAHPAYAHIVLWDFPGAGTLRQSDQSTYFEDSMLYAFDCILVLAADRFLTIDFEIAKKAMQYKKPCAFVRTKADQSLKSIAERKAKTMRDASKDLRLIVDESFQKGLKDAGFLPETFLKLFIVSAWAFSKRSAYILYDPETDECDTTLDYMDEDQLIVFVTNSARPRLPPGAGNEGV